MNFLCTIVPDCPNPEEGLVERNTDGGEDMLTMQVGYPPRDEGEM